MYKLQIQDLKVKESRFFVIPVFFPIPLQPDLAKQDHSRTFLVIPAKAGISMASYRLWVPVRRRG